MTRRKINILPCPHPCSFHSSSVRVCFAGRKVRFKACNHCFWSKTCISRTMAHPQRKHISMYRNLNTTRESKDHKNLIAIVIINRVCVGCYLEYMHVWEGKEKQENVRITRWIGYLWLLESSWKDNRKEVAMVIYTILRI